MSDLAVRTGSGVPVASYGAAQTAQTAPAQVQPARTDVIDLSKPPTAEQVERLRSAGILGYGSVSAQQSLTQSSREDGSRVTHFTVDYQFEYFDLVQKTVTRHSSTGIGAFTSDGAAAAFQGVTTQVTFDASRYWTGQLGDTADRMAASYQAKASYLEVNFSGQELQNQMSRLEDTYQAAKGEAVDSFTRLLGRFLTEQERAGQEQTIRGSVQAVFARYEAKYQSIAASQDKNGWMGATLYESTVSLQKLSASLQWKQGDEGHWSLGELDFAAVSISAYQAALTSGGDKEQQSMQLRGLSMRVEAMSVRGLLRGDLAQLLRLSGQNALAEADRDGLNLLA